MSRSLQSISIVSVATMASRVLGLVRDSLTAAVFGASALASAFYTAFTLPNLFRRLLGEGALTAAFMPTLHEELEHRRRAGAFALVSQVASWLLIATGIVVAIATVLFSQTAWWETWARARGVDEATLARWLQGAHLALLLFPYLIFVCLAAAFSAALQALNRFLEPALSPIWLNLCMIGLLAGAAYGGWADTASGRMQWLCAGVLFGGFLQMLVPAWALAREGWRPAFDLRLSPPVRAILRLMGPTVFGSAIYLINMAVSRLIALSLNDAAVTVLNLGTRLMELPIGVFAVAISTVVFAQISRLAAQGEFAALARTYQRGMRLNLVINVPAAAGLALLAEPIVRLLFERGAFSAADTAMLVPVVQMLAVGLPFYSFVNLVLRAFYARKDMVTPVRAAALSFVVNLLLSLALMGPLSTLGLALAGNVAIGVQAWFLQRRLARLDPGLALGPLTRDLGKVAAATAGMSLVVAAAGWGWRTIWPATAVTDATGLGILILIGVATYAGLLRVLRIEGWQDLAELGRRWRQRVGR